LLISPGLPGAGGRARASTFVWWRCALQAVAGLGPAGRGAPL